METLTRLVVHRNQTIRNFKHDNPDPDYNPHDPHGGQRSKDHNRENYGIRICYIYLSTQHQSLKKTSFNGVGGVVGDGVVQKTSTLSNV